MLTRPALLFVVSALVLCGSGCAHHASATAAGNDRSRGAAIYAKNCRVCHSAFGSRIGPPLERVGHTLPLDQIVSTIEDPDPPMPKLYPSVLSRQDVDDVAAYVKSL
jgi:alcohol dehydrogenase (cytochrome c)